MSLLHSVVLPAIALGVIVLSLHSAYAAGAAAVLPGGFRETVVMTGLDQPTSVEFASDGSIVVAEKSGIVKSFEGFDDATPTVLADLRTNVHNYWDRGLLGLALDPAFPVDPDVYVLYTHDAAIGGVAPRWGTSGVTSDPCPTPPGPTADGCVVSGRLSVLRPPTGPTVAYRDAVLADAPVSYWRLGESSGSTAVDSSGNGRPGSYVGAPSHGAPGAIAADSNTAVAFDGASSYVAVPNAATLNGSRFSVEAWAYVTGGQGTYRSVVTSRDYPSSATRGYILYASAANAWELWLGNGSVGWVQLVGPAVALSRWVHLVATYDGKTARLYVDGVQAAATNLAFSPNLARPLRLGAGATETAPEYFFPGRVDEVSVYDVALPANRVVVHHAAGTGTPPPAEETVLVEDWCLQYPSLATGDLAFGGDGALYATGGNGGSFTFSDYGQDGSPPNPCGDPPGGLGAALVPPTAEGGSLRSQDIRTSADPTGLGGSLIRVDKETGAGLSGNPFASSSDPNNRRIIAYGLRNPFRLAIRPGTSEVWIGDVGGGIYEEIDRVTSPNDATVENFGWPCYEGSSKQPGFDAIDLNLCESLYTQSGATVAPWFSYLHGQPIVAGEACTTGNSSISGLAFARTTGSPYPSEYDGALFFSDYSRRCLWVMRAGAGGLPDPGTLTVFATDVASPVELELGMDGKVYYVDLDGGTIRRLDYFAGNQPPTAVASASPTSGPLPLAVGFDGSASSDADGTIAAYHWDLDGDGAFDDASGARATFTYTAPGLYTARLRVTDDDGASTLSDPIAVSAGNAAPTALIDSPPAGFTYRVGDVVSFSGRGTDPEDGMVSAARMTWEVILHHCPSAAACHSHPVQSFDGVASGSFSVPDHEFPSHVELTLTVTDSVGVGGTASVQLSPRTVTLQLTSEPIGLALSVNEQTAPTPFSQVVLEGSAVTVSAPSLQSLGGQSYGFSTWSDGGAQTHNITASASSTVTATYTGRDGSVYSAAVLSDAPEGYWRLGESAGVTAWDSSGNGLTGSYVGAPSLARQGALRGDDDTAAGFDGTTSFVGVPYAIGLSPSSFTVEAWAYATGGDGTYRSLVTSRDFDGVTRGFALYASSADTWELWLGTGAGWWVQLTGPAVTPSTWTHLVATYDGATARLYVDGTLAASAVLPFTPNASKPLRIAAGASEGAPGYFLPGRVDEVAVYDTPLSVARILAHFEAATASAGNASPTAVASGSPMSGPAPLSVVFDGSGSSDPDGTIVAYAWDLDGDGAFDDSTAQQPTHTYAMSGTHTVRLRVTDNVGADATSGPLAIRVDSAGYAGVVLADAPTGYWRLGEAGGATAADASGSGLAGSYVASPTLGVTGALTGDANTATGFNGSSQHVSVPYAEGLNGSVFTIEAWAYLTGGQGTYRSLVTSRDYDGTTRGFILYATAGNAWALWLGSGAGWWNQLDGPPVASNTWTHVVATYDGTMARLYVNGSLSASAVLPFSPNTARPLRIAAGASDGPPSYFFPGRVDEAAVYGGALPASRVRAHFDAAAFMGPE